MMHLEYANISEIIFSTLASKLVFLRHNQVGIKPYIVHQHTSKQRTWDVLKENAQHVICFFEKWLMK